MAATPKRNLCVTVVFTITPYDGDDNTGRMVDALMALLDEVDGDDAEPAFSIKRVR